MLAESRDRTRSTERDLPLCLGVPRPEAVSAGAQQGLERLRRRDRQQRSQHAQRATEVRAQVGLCGLGFGFAGLGPRRLCTRVKVRAGDGQSHLLGTEVGLV